MNLPKIHLIAPAGSLRPFLEMSGLGSPGRLVQTVQDAVGPRYLVTGNHALFDAAEDDEHGGRLDDRERAEDIQQALADPKVVAIVAVRGGAWMTRILGHIDFSVLAGRPTPVALFGFSELTTLVNIVAGYDYGLGVYDLSPAFLPYALKRYAAIHQGSAKSITETPKEWMRSQLLPRFRDLFVDVVSMIEGRGSTRRLEATLIQGEVPDRSRATFIGGNLALFTTLIGTRYQHLVAPDGRWLVLEDFNEDPYRIDRMFAQLTLAGYWETCAGVLLGDFHTSDRVLDQAVLALLKYHLPADQSVPLLITGQVGHVWPMSPIPLQKPLTLERAGGNKISISWPKSLLETVSRE